MFALLPVFVWVFALLGVGAGLLGVVGQCGCVRPFAPACLLACSRSGVGLLACARLLRCGSNGNGAGQSLSRPIQRGAAPVALCAREGLGGAPRGVLTRARTRGEG